LQVDTLGTKRRQPVRIAGSDSSLDVVETVDGVGQDHQHRQVAIIGQLDHRGAGDAGVAEVCSAGHHAGSELARRGREREVGRGVGFEGIEPPVLEVQGVDQHEASAPVEGAGREKLLEAIVGAQGGPAVDGDARLFGIVREVDLRERGAVAVFEQGQEVALERNVLLSPEPVGDLKLHAVASVDLVERVQQAAEGSMRFRQLARVEVEDVRHLDQRSAARPRRRHGQRDRCADGGADKVAAALLDACVEVEPEPVAGVDGAVGRCAGQRVGAVR
jgi:hypothetical protein